MCSTAPTLCVIFFSAAGRISPQAGMLKLTNQRTRNRRIKEREFEPRHSSPLDSRNASKARHSLLRAGGLRVRPRGYAEFADAPRLRHMDSTTICLVPNDIIMTIKYDPFSDEFHYCHHSSLVSHTTLLHRHYMWCN